MWLTVLTLCPLVWSAHNFANRLDPDQAGQNVGPDLDPSCFDTYGIPERIFQKRLILKKINRRQKSMIITQDAKSLCLSD